jgi:hypothetical protein
VFPSVGSVLGAVSRLVVGILKGMAGVGIDHNFDFVALLFPACSNFFTSSTGMPRSCPPKIPSTEALIFLMESGFAVGSKTGNRKNQ